MKALRHRYEYRGSGFLRRKEGRFDDTGEVEYSGPLAFAVRLPDDFAVEDRCDFGGGEIAMEVEVLRVRVLVLSAETDAVGQRCPLGGEDERYVVTPWIGGCFFDLVQREVQDRCGLDGMIGEAEFGTVEL